jgi:type IVB pilus formation R64 PilN family outer membrane protein
MNASLKTYVALLPMAALMALTGCTSPQIAGRVADDNKVAAATVASAVNGAGIAKNAGPLVAGGLADADRRAAEQASQVVLRRATKPWVASVSVPMGSGDKLPSVFQEPVNLSFNDSRSGGKVSLRMVADRITAATGVPVRIKPDVFVANSASAPTSMPPPPMPGMGSGYTAGVSGASAPGLPPMGQPTGREALVETVAMRWSGSLEGYLNHITDLTNLSWEYRDGVVVIERFRTEFFEIATMDGETSYTMGLNASDQGSTSGGQGQGAGSSANNASADVSERGKASTVATLLAAINQIIRDVPGSSTVRSDGSGRIAVTTTKETMAKVRDFVRAENEVMLRQAQIQFDIYSVRTSESDERGVDWNLVIRSLSDAIALKVNSPSTLTGPASGDVGFSVLSPTETSSSRAVRFADTSAILKLLNQHGNASQHRPVSLLTLNRQWARKASLGSQAYVSETTPGAASSLNSTAGAPGLKTSTVTTGDRYLAQPYIMDNNTVVLKFGIGLSSLVGLPSFVSAGQTIQTPEVTNIIDQSTIALKAGQVLVITGLSRIVSSEETRTLSENAPVGAGGSKKLTRQREDFIIFVRPTIL